MKSLVDLNVRISKLFNNPNINFFIIMNLILLITCYAFISAPIKNTISSIISNPIVIILFIISILIIGYVNITIAVLLLILFFIALYNMQIQDMSSDMLENFTDNDDQHIVNINKLKQKEENDKQLDERVNNIKNVVLGTINKFKNNNDNNYKQALLENKKQLYTAEKNYNNKRNKKNKNNNITSVDKFNNIDNNKKGKEEFQTIQSRTFDPSSEEDTNLLITKEILQDMNNRIEYNYESNKYLKKYIKHRVEEIVDLNNLIDDE